jgi:hypothetical protein
VCGEVHALTAGHLAIFVPKLACLSKVVEFFKAVSIYRRVEEKEGQQQTAADHQTEGQSKSLWDSVRSGAAEGFSDLVRWRRFLAMG